MFYFQNKKEIWWPKIVQYAGKKYYTQSSHKELQTKTTTDIIYFCTNHRINTIKKKLLFKNNPVNGKIKFYRIKEQFYWIKNHNNTCDNRNPPIHDNITNVTKKIYGFDISKENMINYLNKNSLVTYTHFKDFAIEIF